jgi:hypothetical protein
MLASLAAAALALSMLPAAAVAQEPPSGYIAPCFGGETWTAAPGEPLHFVCAWGAQGGPGKIVSFLTSQRATVIVRDEEDNVVLRLDPEEIRALYGPPHVYPADDDFVACAGPDFQLAVWHYWLNEGLPEGVYEVTWIETLTHPVNDGYHTCWLREDGSRLVPAPSIYRGTTTAVSTLIVGD